jgi:phosphoribosylanthranilate isomerase
MGVKIKICGITNLDDAWAAIDAGADALGFILYEASPRYVPLSQLGKILGEIPPFISRVGVFVNAAEEVVLRSAGCGLDTLQFHGHETSTFCNGFPFKTIKAFLVKDPTSLAGMTSYARQAWLLDTYVAGQHGGTGSTFNWEIAAEAVKLSRSVILAGGLTPGNVAGAVAQVRPYAVDVSSGVELKPGKKDATKLRDFIAAARAN